MLLSFVLKGRMAIVAGLVAGMLEPASASVMPVRAASTMPAVEHKVYGTVQSLGGGTLVIRTRTGKLLTVDGHLARSNVLLRRDRPVIVYGTADAAGVIHARAVWRTFPDSTHWPADR